MTIYALGDIHGRLDCLRRAQAAIDRDAKSRGDGDVLEIYVGDYIDRGPDSAAVIENIIARSQRQKLLALLGNHETMLTSFLDGGLKFSDWRDLGGAETVMSYGVNVPRVGKEVVFSPTTLASHIPKMHRDFLSGLQPYLFVGDYCFVHAGLRPGVPLERQSLHDLTWIREDFLEYPGSFGCVVVHGHTPVRDVEFHRHRINIDTGAYLSNKLSVLRIDENGPMPLEIEAT